MALPQRKKISISILIPFAILALVFGILVWKKIQDTSQVQPQPVSPHVSSQVSSRTGVLFFIAPDGTSLMREGRELDPCDDQISCLNDLMEELLGGPVGDLKSAIPETAAIISVSITGSQATIDFNQSFADDLLSGSAAELLAVYAIVNTVTVNFPQISSVKLMVAGNPATVLRHLDLREPLQPDFSLEFHITDKQGVTSDHNATQKEKK